MKQSDNSTGKTYALLTAVGDYSKMNATNLPTYSGDLSFIKNSLIQGLMVDPDNIRLIGNHGKVQAKELALALKSFTEMLKEEDNLIFYFSGHGKQSELVFSDMTLKLDSVLGYFSKLSCKSKLIILDCCYAGDFKVGGPKQMNFRDTISSFVGTGIAIMASSAADEVSRLGIGKKYSLYTEFVGTAMMSKRRIRKGLLSLEDLNREVLQMMTVWNEQHPERRQHPIFRSCLGGTIYFKVSDYTPYKPTNIYLSTNRYIIHSVKSLSTNKYKRICAFVICDDPESISNLPAITREIAYRIKDENIFSSEDEEKRFANMEAHVVWCYFGKDESDLIHHLHYAYTIWAANEAMEKLYFKEHRYAHVADGIYIYQNTSYEMLKIMQTPTVTRDEFILSNQKMLAEIVSMAEQFIFDLHEIVNRTIDIPTIQKKYRRWIVAVREKYILLSDMDASPDDLLEWADEIMDLAGWVVDMSLMLDGDIGAREAWLINNAMRQYNESLIRLKNIEKDLIVAF